MIQPQPSPLEFPARDAAVPPAGAVLGLRGVAFRRATEADLSFLLTLYGDVRSQELALIEWPPGAKAAFLDSQFRLQHLAYTSNYPDADFLIVERRKVPVGRLYLARTRHDLLIVDVSLTPAHQGKGLGRALLKRTAALARQEDLARVSLHVATNNPRARQLYERLGFKAGMLEGSHLRMALRVDE
jgi:RimJ/RimL family protein N-acetyltransferase